jgi:hypothetical protein
VKNVTVICMFRDDCVPYEYICRQLLYRFRSAATVDGALLDWRLTPGVRGSWWPAAVAVGALGGPAAGARAGIS